MVSKFCFVFVFLGQQAFTSWVRHLGSLPGPYAGLWDLTLSKSKFASYATPFYLPRTPKMLMKSYYAVPFITKKCLFFHIFYSKHLLIDEKSVS